MNDGKCCKGFPKDFENVKRVNVGNLTAKDSKFGTLL
jgi:hypothetical protein